MEYLQNQKFIPEGWEESITPMSKNFLQNAMQENSTLQGIVTKCDSNYNLYVDLGDDLTGIIPRQEVEAIKIDKNGCVYPQICANKVNKFVQFKVKQVDENDNICVLSRKAVGKEALDWINKDLQEGQVVNRNSKKCATIWCICRNRWRSCRAFTY